MRKTIKLKCKICGRYFEKLLSIYKQDIKKCKAGKFCSLSCFYKSTERKSSLNKKGKDAARWKGGRIFERGYKLVMANGHPNAVIKGHGIGYVREHRLVMEKHIGRFLSANEVVHHIDGDTLNNSIKNLRLMKRGEHDRLHRLKEGGSK